MTSKLEEMKCEVQNATQERDSAKAERDLAKAQIHELEIQLQNAISQIDQLKSEGCSLSPAEEATYRDKVKTEINKDRRKMLLEFKPKWVRKK